MPSQMSQEQSDLTQAQNSDRMAWSNFSGFQWDKTKADNAKCNLLNQEDVKEHLNNGIVFDPGSTVDCFKNPDLVQDIQQTKKVVELKTNAGSKLNNGVAWLPNCGEVWFDKDALANTVSLKNVKKMFKVDCNSEVEDAFILTNSPKDRQGHQIQMPREWFVHLCTPGHMQKPEQEQESSSR